MMFILLLHDIYVFYIMFIHLLHYLHASVHDSYKNNDFLNKENNLNNKVLFFTESAPFEGREAQSMYVI